MILIINKQIRQNRNKTRTTMTMVEITNRKTVTTQTIIKTETMFTIITMNNITNMTMAMMITNMNNNMKNNIYKRILTKNIMLIINHRIIKRLITIKVINISPTILITHKITSKNRKALISKRTIIIITKFKTHKQIITN